MLVIDFSERQIIERKLIGRWSNVYGLKSMIYGLFYERLHKNPRLENGR